MLSDSFKEYVNDDAEIIRDDESTTRFNIYYQNSVLVSISIDDQENSANVFVAKKISQKYSDHDILKYVNDLNKNTPNGVYAIYSDGNIIVSKFTDDIKDCKKIVDAFDDCQYVFSNYVEQLK